MAKPDKESCGNCYYYDEQTPKSGVCREGPASIGVPIGVKPSGEPLMAFYQPWTNPSGWCGKWRLGIKKATVVPMSPPNSRQ